MAPRQLPLYFLGAIDMAQTSPSTRPAPQPATGGDGIFTLVLALVPVTFVGIVVLILLLDP